MSSLSCSRPGMETPDVIIYYCQLNDICCINNSKTPNTPHRNQLVSPCYNNRIVRVENFLFDCHHHDTGNSLRAWIINWDTEETFCFLDGTYWFSTQYLFNKFIYIDGKWNKKYNETIEFLRHRMNAHKQSLQIAKFVEIEHQKMIEQEKINKFEKLF